MHIQGVVKVANSVHPNDLLADLHATGLDADPADRGLLPKRDIMHRSGAAHDQRNQRTGFSHRVDEQAWFLPLLRVDLS